MQRWPHMIPLAIITLILLALVASYAAYARDMQTIRARLAATSILIPGPSGPVEYTTGGSGTAVLALHGAGGGFDQGALFATTFFGDDFHWIAPSRFGYLRFPLPDDASTAAQADAFAALLDGLGIERVAIIAISGGVPPALQFAARYPDRTSALVLLSSAPHTPYTTEQQGLPIPAWLYQALFSSNFPYWALSKTARPALEGIFDVTPELRSGMSEEERVFLAGMVDLFQPVTQRLDGVRNEGAAIDPAAQYDLGAITAPTLIIHSRDDGLNPFEIAQGLAREIAGAELVPLESGGHLMLGHHDGVRARVSGFLTTHTGGA
ncbi:alpha/beta fold hydrolase [Maricaulis salignorans]|uniref:alpha/beta fold hydrolase n=1 Tax=Maricaulis salignorans TaxID=144026 RepID=UPI003A95C5B1